MPFEAINNALDDNSSLYRAIWTEPKAAYLRTTLLVPVNAVILEFTTGLDSTSSRLDVQFPGAPPASMGDMSSIPAINAPVYIHTIVRCIRFRALYLC